VREPTRLQQLWSLGILECPEDISAGKEGGEEMPMQEKA
jgi:hypothetical protein